MRGAGAQTLRVLSAGALALLFALMVPQTVKDPAPGPPAIPEPKGSDLLPAIHINVYEYGFEPRNLVVKVGHVVSWRAAGKEPHLVTPATNEAAWVFYSAKSTGTVRHVFKRPGVYQYYCEFHPKRMRGTVTVKRKV